MLRTIRVLATVLAIGALLTASALSALADAGGRKVLDASLVGLPAGQVGQTLFGVTAGGLPWRLDHGSAQVFSDGRIHVEVQGLVLAAGALEGTNPIPNGQAIVTCAGAPAATSSVVPFSAGGDAQINEQIALPSGCLGPAVFFAGVPAPGVDRWFAVSGW